MYIIVLFLNLLTVRELSTERHFTVWAAKLNQHVCYKGIMTPKFGSKAMLFWKRHSPLDFTENENLWIASDQYGLMDQDPLKSHQEHPKNCFQK